MILRGLLQFVKPRPTRSPFNGRLHPRDQLKGMNVAARVLLTELVGENSPAMINTFQKSLYKNYFTRPCA